jgi:hypothetical protein
VKANRERPGTWHKDLAPVVGIEPTLTRFWRPPLYR